MAENFEQYYEERYEDQKGWYDDKAVKNKRYYLVFRVAVLVFAAAIPTAVSFIPSSDNSTVIINIITVLAFMLLVSEGVLSIFNFHHKWQSYRTTAEALKKEGERFNTKTGGYEGIGDPESLFIDRVEELVSQEHRYWKMLSTKQKGEGKL